MKKNNHRGICRLLGGAFCRCAFLCVLQRFIQSSDG